MDSCAFQLRRPHSSCFQWLSASTSADFQFQAAAPPITNVTVLDDIDTAVISDTYPNSTIQVTQTGVSVTTVSGFDLFAMDTH